MPINWDGNKLKAFRLALQDVYPDYDDLEIFLLEDLGINIANISEKTTIDKVTFRLLQKADKDAVFEAFRQARPDHPVIAQLQQQPLVKRRFCLLEADWHNLFSSFSNSDSPYLEIACRYAFRAVFNRSFEDIRPDHPPLNEPILVQELLAKYDDPKLAVRFVEAVIVELRRSNNEESRDLSAVEQWRDRIAQQYSVPLKAFESELTVACHAYLLVALKEIGSKVNVYPELHITGAEFPIQFGATPTTCTISQIPDLLSRWIKKAEATEEIRRCESPQVILEVFLPCPLLEEDIATEWKLKDEWENERELGIHRRFLVRSAERLLNPRFQSALIGKWRLLEKAVKTGNGCSGFHCQDDYVNLKRGELAALLNDLNATGVKLTAKLPSDSSKRNDVFKEIIEAAVPIALWFSGSIETDANTLNTEFDALLDQVPLTNFAELARQWRMQRRNSELAKHIRLLCDCPHRFPKLPDPNQEDDLLVAS